MTIKKIKNIKNDFCQALDCRMTPKYFWIWNGRDWCWYYKDINSYLCHIHYNQRVRWEQNRVK